MSSHIGKISKNKNEVADNSPKRQSNVEATFQLVDNRPEAIAQQELQQAIHNSPRVQQLQAYQDMADNSPQVKQLSAYQEMADEYTSPTVQRKANTGTHLPSVESEPVQRKANTTGLPDQLVIPPLLTEVKSRG